jgi:hypothetical protein
VFKLANAGTYWRFDGALDVAGTPDRPVVLTELRDDAYGGDTNGDGAASAPAQGFWHGVMLHSSADAMLVDGLLVRHAGHAGYAGIDVSAPLAVVRNVRAELCAADGIEADQYAAAAQGWAAYDCEGDGIEMQGGVYDLDHATAARCTGSGIRKNPGWTGSCTNSISWANAGANYAGFAAGELRYSDGSPSLAGQDGNLDLDPDFFDLDAGDLRLAATSPCIDAGDPLALPDIDGSRTDMGAYPFNHCAPVSYCTGKVNSQGCVPTIQATGFASLSSSEPFEIRAVDVLNQKAGHLFYGLNGRFAKPFLGGILCLRGPVMRTPIVHSGGNPAPDDCSGVLSFDFDAWLEAGSDPRLAAGVTVDGQFWYRDPASRIPAGLSNGIEFTICP